MNDLVFLQCSTLRMTLFPRELRTERFVVVVTGADVTERPTLPRQMELAKVFAVNVPLVDKSLLV